MFQFGMRLKLKHWQQAASGTTASSKYHFKLEVVLHSI
jgi:hypothetical protein